MSNIRKKERDLLEESKMIEKSIDFYETQIARTLLDIELLEEKESETKGFLAKYSGLQKKLENLLVRFNLELNNLDAWMKKKEKLDKEKSNAKKT